MCQFLRLKTKIFLRVNIPVYAFLITFPSLSLRNKHYSKFVIPSFVFNLNLEAHVSVFNHILI